MGPTPGAEERDAPWPLNVTSPKDPSPVGVDTVHALYVCESGVVGTGVGVQQARLGVGVMPEDAQYQKDDTVGVMAFTSRLEAKKSEPEYAIIVSPLP